VISAELLGDGPALDRLRALPDAANAGLARAISKLGVALQSNVQQDKLSGEVLKVRSGALKSSIDVDINKSAAGVTAIFGDSQCQGESTADQTILWPPDRDENGQRARAYPPDGSARALVSSVGARRHGTEH
jgi:hypothetical protein